MTSDLIAQCLTTFLALAGPLAAPGSTPGEAKPAVAKPKAAKPAKAKAKPASESAVLIDKVQRFYDQTKDFSADFTQRYTRVALSKTAESRGVVMIKKPGLMRWEYQKPAVKLFVADGEKLYVYEPEEQQVIVDPHFKASELTSSIRFLWGEGKLTDSFTVEPSDEKPSTPSPGARALALTPKSDASYTKLILIVDSATGQVLETVLHETGGNTNHFIFSGMKTNPGLKPELFTFVVPPGVQRVERP